MASDSISQVKVAPEPDFMNLGNATARVPSDTSLVYVGLPCANPEFKGMVTMAENNATSSRFYNRPGRPTLRRAEASFDLYMRSTGASGTFTDPMFDILDACFGKQKTSNASYTVSAWTSTTQATLASVANLGVGQGFAVAIGGVKYVSFIKTIAGNVITFEPALPGGFVSEQPATIRGGRTYAIGRDYADASSVSLLLLKEAFAFKGFGFQGKTFDLPLVTGEMATARVTMVAGYAEPVADAEAVQDTTEPDGTWLKFLNATLKLNGSDVDCHDCKFTVDFAPQAKASQANEGGLTAWEMGKPSITAVVTLSEFDSQYVDFVDNATEFSVLAHMGTTAGGSAVAVYVPRMHLADYPEPTAVNDLTALPLNLRVGNMTGDTGDYSATADVLIDTIFRIFFEAGA